ncbi:MAG: tRNA 2-thiouridine(34) synthase MnmA [Gammaproteobacteria bacterium]|nr:MAG: tRNA 2-thiouridine(34) synthase MnmA [Gammaproteobacteria bacterium]
MNIVVGLSGGVDSAVAALLLKQAGHEVTAVFMKNWEEDDSSEYCSAKEDLEDACKIADKIGIELKTINFATEYWDKVFEIFLDEYKKGRTPNPDVLCNSEIKFKAFLEYANDLGATKIATGHYATIHENNNIFYLKEANDKHKDQTYFLHRLNQYQLSHTMCPLSDIDKNQVRQIAKQNSFEVYNKKDSTGICFIGQRRFKEFLNQYIPANPGFIVDEKEQILGEHDGIYFYTIGQRQGLKIGGKKDYQNIPWFVLEKDIKNNKLIVGQNNNNPRLLKNNLIAYNCSWINDDIQKYYKKPLLARIRHGQQKQKCKFYPIDDETIAVDFTDKQRAIAAGQAVVLYDNEICLGGAIIK